ncbi:hypothetical protein [Massilia sp. TN1-12]|uniref:hypothetical protein n=1 Tax=Massilia paldalensis TaxID=3377675 RepID=UPI00384ADD83
MQASYTLTITYDLGKELATWSYDNVDRAECCGAHPGDFIDILFDGPGDVSQAVMLCGQMGDEKISSPFVQGNQIDVTRTPTLQVGKNLGRWGFSLAFSTRNADGTSSFYYLPDPEVIIRSRPGSDD